MQRAHRVPKQRRYESEESVLLDVHATAAAPVPQLLSLPRPRAVGVPSIPKPAHALVVGHAPGCEACKGSMRIQVSLQGLPGKGAGQRRDFGSILFM